MSHDHISIDRNNFSSEEEYQDELNRLTAETLRISLEQAYFPPHATLKEYEAVRSLLDDPDSRISGAAKEKLRSYGAKISPVLRTDLRENIITDPQAITIATAVLRSFQREAIDGLLDMVRECSEARRDLNLEEMFIGLSQFGYPETDAEALRKGLDDIALRVHALFMKSQQHNELGLVLSMNQAFFEESRFSGAADDEYHHPDNTYAHIVMRRRLGIPISLCVAYLLVAERADVGVYGVGMPAHFVVYHPELDVFIDAFGKGAFLSRDDCKRFIRDAGFSFEESMLEKSSNIAILLRMIRNLIFAYTKMQAEWEVEALHELSATIIEAMNQEEE
ncbi:MAG: transglutaminase-like domain-containing protein [Candidatus Kapabacteria bacterium]|jgi:regulator of sirC expression with transglutaminase-like and TPR domain|nr:transglutaminase-like domain-containing protein [Candidatus Kapabacteria bacterium]